jgi:hypothetical protein
MAHSNPVADRYRIKFKGSSAGLTNRVLDHLCHLVEMDVAGDYLAKAVGDADERLIDVGVFKAAGAKQTAMRGPLETLFDCITFHNPVSPIVVGKIIRKNQKLDSNRWLKANKEKSVVFEKSKCIIGI